MEKQLIAHVRRDRSTGEVIATQSLKCGSILQQELSGCQPVQNRSSSRLAA